MAEIQEPDNKGIWREVRELPNDDKICFSLEEGYTLTSDRMSYLCDNSSEDIAEKRVYELQKNKTPILSFRHEELGVKQAFTDGDKAAYRESLYANIQHYIIQNEKPDIAAWIKKNFERKPADIPPWERTEPARKIPNNLKEIEFTLNDDGDAIRFERECRGYLIYATNTGTWYAWVTNHWEEAGDRLGHAARFIGNTIEKEYETWRQKLISFETKGSKNLDELEKKEYAAIKAFTVALKKHVNYAKSSRGISSMLNLCSTSTMAINLEEKTNINLIAFKNGILDTGTGTIYDNHEAEQFKEEYLTRYIDRTYIKNSIPNTFISHLQTVFYDNVTPGLSIDERARRMCETWGYFDRLLGYLLIPGNPEQIFIILWGEGSNGKSTTIDVLRDVLGPEMSEASCKELYTSSEDKPANGISCGLGRLVILFPEASDSDENKPYGGKFSRDTIKALTGDRYTARFRKMHQGGRRQRIICKPIAITNELPHFDKEVDEALLRRIITIPHQHKFTGDEKDREILNKLLCELDEIFSLMVDACIAYRRGKRPKENGSENKNRGHDEGHNPGLLKFPDFCRNTQDELLAGAEYNAFIDATYTKTKGETPEERTQRNIIEQRYIDWCDSNGIDCKTILRPSGGFDEWGTPLKTRRLTEGEQRRLYKAFRVKGFGEGSTTGKRYIKCKERKQPQT